MTTGFDYILNSLLPSRRRAAPTIAVPLGAEVRAMLEELARGQDIPLEELAATLLAQAVVEHYEAKSENLRHWEELSQRQQQVAALACLGYTNAEIALKLNISLTTVKTHMREILRKFDVRGRHQLRYMLRRWDFSAFDDSPPEGGAPAP